MPEVWEVFVMDKNNAKTRNKIKSISDIKDFESLLERAMISEEQKQIMRLIYKENKNISYVADIMNLSERTVSNRHSKALLKIGKLF